MESNKNDGILAELNNNLNKIMHNLQYEIITKNYETRDILYNRTITLL